MVTKGIRSDINGKHTRHHQRRERRGLARLIRFRSGRSLRRELWKMEYALAADAPKLASMFEVFNLLTRYERPVGIEPLASPAPLLRAPLLRAPLMSRRSRGSAGPAGPRRLAAIATLLALAAVAVACFAISTQVRPAGRSCLVATPAGFGYTVSRAPGCQPSPLKKQ